METIAGYRHVVDKNTKKIFLESFKEAIEKNRLSHLGFIGVIGSFNENVSHDIDILIFPNEKSKIGESIIEMIKLFDELDLILKEKHHRYYSVTCPRKTMQELMYYLASLEEGSAGLIPIHSLFFTDYESFKRINPVNFIKGIDEKVISLFGNFKIIKKLKKLPQGKLEPYFLILDFEMNARIKNFPKHLIRTSAESLFEYLNDKYGIDVGTKDFHKVEKIEKLFFGVLEKLDEINYE